MVRRSVLIAITAFAAITIGAACAKSDSDPYSVGPDGAPEAGSLDAPIGTADAGGEVDGGASPGAPLPALPLRTQSRFIVDAKGKRFKLAGASWYGAESKDYVPAGLDHAKLGDIAKHVRERGFNSIRLPWSNELVELDPIVDAAKVSANPQLAGKRALEVFDAVIAALAHEGIVVVLDNHVSKAGWCCTETDGNGLWYTTEYPESSFLADWKKLAARYRGQPAVVGAELRNELRTANGVVPTWGTGTATTDWRAAAQRAGNAVLGENPDLLVLVDGLSYSADLGGAYTDPIALAVPNRVVYAPHDYAFFHAAGQSTQDLKTALGNRWGFLITQGQPFTAPVVVTEWGTCNTAPSCVLPTEDQGKWFTSFTSYLTDGDIDWMYWPLNGTQATGDTRTFGAPETYGLMDPTWTKRSLQDLDDALKPLIPSKEGP